MSAMTRDGSIAESPRSGILSRFNKTSKDKSAAPTRASTVSKRQARRRGPRAKSMFFPGTPVQESNKIELKFPELTEEAVKSHRLTSSSQASMLFANVRFSGRITDRKQRNMVLSTHCRFIKHGRSGAPKLREINVNVDTGMIFWGSGAVGSDSKNKCAYIDDLIEIWDGKHSAIFKRETAKYVEPELCFSLVFPNRTLDLEALAPKQKELWTEAMIQLKLEKALISFDPTLIAESNSSKWANPDADDDDEED